MALVCFAVLTAIFATYFLCILRNKKKNGYLRAINEAINKPLLNDDLPKISILIPAYNEEKVIEAKLKDIAAMQYPQSKREVLVIDDCSTDATRLVAERAFRELDLIGKVVWNSERLGVNGCYNTGRQESTGDLIATTDADVMVDHDALIKAVKVLDSLRDVGSLFARMMPMSAAQTAAVNIEDSYRNLWDEMFIAESAIHSTFPGYTNFSLTWRSLFPTMSLDYGSSDGNIAFAVIRKGFRYVCVPSILFYEQIAESFPEQVRQKTRRAARIIQSATANKDMLFGSKYGTFGTFIFPLRMLLLISPLVSVLGCIALLAALAYVSIYSDLVLVLVLLASYIGDRLGIGKVRLLWSLVVHQCYLLAGLFLSIKKRGVWSPVQRSSIGRS